MRFKKVSLILVTLVTFFACSNEEAMNPSMQGLQVSADFLKLSDNNSITAGNLVINADVPEVTVRWNTGNLCNLDTAQTTLRLSKGNATLPIKWMEKLESGTYGPEGVAFKAGVQIIAGKESRYVPLVWAEKIDSTVVLKSAVQTRAAGDMMPRVTQISMIPSTVNMNDVNGGTMYIGLTDVSFAILDVSEITSDLNIDMTKIPNYIMASQMLDFKWTAAGAPAFGFSARIVAMSEGITQSGIVNYSNGGGVTPGKFSVNFRATTGGTVSLSSGTGALNETVSSTASAKAAGYTFEGWYDTANNTKVSSNATLSVTLNSTTNGKTYEARFTSAIQPTVFYMWDAKAPLQINGIRPQPGSDSYYNTGYVAVNSCKNCPTYNDIITALGQGVYWDNVGPEWEGVDGFVHRTGIWVMIRSKWNTSRTATSVTPGTANDAIRNSGDYLFLPAAGYVTNGTPYRVGQTGNYWSSTYFNTSTDYPYSFTCSSYTVEIDYLGRPNGFSLCQF